MINRLANFAFRRPSPATPVGASRANGRATSLTSCISALLLLCSASLVRAELIPADHLTNWTPGVYVGVPGGIPTNRTHLIDVTKAPYNADKSGSTDASAAIQAAINSATAGDVVYLPAGTYLCGTPINTGYKSDFTIRGDGDSTVLKNTVSSGWLLSVGGGADWNWSWPNSGGNVTAGLSKDSTQLTLDDASPFWVGQMIQIKLKNDPAIPVISVYGYENVRRQMTRITAKSGNTITIFPGLYGDYSSTSALIRGAELQANNVGIENLLIDSSGSGATFSVWLQQCYACWVKNVHIQYSANFQLYIADSLNCEIRHCYIDQINHTGPNGAGLLCQTIAGCLVEDNIINKAFPLIEVNSGACGNVFAYNFINGSEPGCAIDSNHGPHNSYNLYEGNVSPNLQCDGFFGSASHDTIFRNWFSGLLNGGPLYALNLNRFTRQYSVVGNILQSPGYTWTNDGVLLGLPNIGNVSSTGSAPPWSDGIQTGAGTLSQSGQNVTTTAPMFTASQVGYFILTPATNLLERITGYTDSQHVTTDSSQNVSGTSYVLSNGADGYQELDTDVARTLLRKGNYYYSSKSIPASEALNGDTLPPSLYRTQKPDWYGSLQWPAFDPQNPNPAPDAIPAGYRFVHGSDPIGTSSGSGATSGGTTTGGTTTGGTGTSTTSTVPLANQSPMNVRVSHPAR